MKERFELSFFFSFLFFGGGRELFKRKKILEPISVSGNAALRCS